MAKPVPEEEKVYSCPYCGVKFKTSEGLVKHLKHCDAKPDAEEEEPIAAGAGGIPLYSTPAQKTRTPKEPDEDEAGDGDGDEDEDEDEEKDEDEYACPECDYSAKRPFRKCPKCGTKLEWD